MMRFGRRAALVAYSQRVGARQGRLLSRRCCDWVIIRPFNRR